MDLQNITYHRISDSDNDKMMIVIRCDNDSDKIFVLSSNITPQKYTLFYSSVKSPQVQPI